MSDTTSSLSAAIARECARIHTHYRGRGPSKTRVFLRPEIVIVLMEDTLTTSDKSLVAAGKEGLVDEMRAEFQATMQEELVEVVERLMGNTVIAFMSANHLEPDMSAEVFVLTPAG